jgi:hypothetical protein
MNGMWVAGREYVCFPSEFQTWLTYYRNQASVNFFCKNLLRNQSYTVLTRVLSTISKLSSKFRFFQGNLQELWNLVIIKYITILLLARYSFDFSTDFYKKNVLKLDFCNMLVKFEIQIRLYCTKYGISVYFSTTKFHNSTAFAKKNLNFIWGITV